MLARSAVVAVAVLAIGGGALTASAAPKESPRLVLTHLGSPQSSVKAGQSLRLRGRIQNLGAPSQRIRAIVRLRGGGKTIRIARKFVGAPLPGRSKPLHTNAPVPSGTPAGAYHLVVCIPSKGGTKGKRSCRTAKRMTMVEGTQTTDPVTPVVPAPPVAFKPGSRTAGDRLFPEVGNGGYDANHYAIDLDYDWENNSFLAGTNTTMTATATQNLSELSLDFEGLNVGSVTVNSAPATSVRRVAPAACSPSPPAASCGPTKLVITPATGIDDGSEFTVVVNYSGTPVPHVDPDGSIEGWIRACSAPAPLESSLVCDGAFVVNEPVGSMTWFPGNNTMTDKATFDTSITTAESKVAVGSGESSTSNPPPGNGDGTVTWHWIQNNPIPTYLTSGSVGDFDAIDSTISLTAGGRTLPLFTAIDDSTTGGVAGQRTAIDAVLGNTGAIVNYYESQLDYGSFPFDSGGAVVDVTQGVNYTLENATKIHFSSPGPESVNEETLAHEYAHQWFGDSATAATWQDLWFNEGYATWSQWNYSADIDGQDSPATIFANEYTGHDENDEFWSVAPAVLDNDSAQLFNTDATYTRGAMTLEGYREIVGKPKALLLAASLQGEYAYRNITTRQFIAKAEQVSGFTGAQLTLLGDYFEQWLYVAEKPTLTPADFPTPP